MTRAVTSASENGANKGSVLKSSAKKGTPLLKGGLKKATTTGAKSAPSASAKRTAAPRTAGTVSVAANTKSSQVLELNLRRIDPISAAKLAFFVSIAMGIISVVVVSLFWLLLDTSGVIYQFTQAMMGASLGIKSGSILGTTKVALIASLLACVGVVLSTIMAVVFALIYNISASLSGGVKLIFGRD
jgi:hypothetical protein